VGDDIVEIDLDRPLETRFRATEVGNVVLVLEEEKKEVGVAIIWIDLDHETNNYYETRDLRNSRATDWREAVMLNDSAPR